MHPRRLLSTQSVVDKKRQGAVYYTTRESGTTSIHRRNYMYQLLTLSLQMCVCECLLLPFHEFFPSVVTVRQSENPCMTVIVVDIVCDHLDKYVN